MSLILSDMITPHVHILCSIESTLGIRTRVGILHAALIARVSLGGGLVNVT